MTSLQAPNTRSHEAPKGTPNTRSYEAPKGTANTRSYEAPKGTANTRSHEAQKGTPNAASHGASMGTGTEPFVVALDGPAGAGKSSVGLGAARQLGLGYFDTGLLYRVLTWLAVAQRVDAEDAAALAQLVDALDIEVDSEGRVFRADVDITAQLHQPPVDAAVSRVSAHAAVRDAMRPAQRRLIRPPGLVMAGRDIGTVIVPEAPLKIWLNASAEERARRRAAQTGAPYLSVLDGMQRRDALDASRAVAPMTPAADAVELHTDGLSPETVIERIVELARERGGPRPRRAPGKV